MTCFHPLEGAKIAYDGDPSSTYVSFRSKDLEHPNRVGTQYVGCGQCLGCRLESSRQWAMRCVAELSQHQTACFLTLTFDNEHFPENGSISKSFFKDWMKSFRERIRYDSALKLKVPGKKKPKLVGGIQIRFFGCGEYGDKRYEQCRNFIVIFHIVTHPLGKAACVCSLGFAFLFLCLCGLCDLGLLFLYSGAGSLFK